MPDIEEIKARSNKVLAALWRMTKEQEDICTAGMTSGVGTADYPGVAELEELRQQTDMLRRQLQELKSRSRLDPEVMQMEKQLDDALRRYYWLWQKCKDNAGDQS